ncbi:MAG TPA: UTP--glucose-1-phosphate uridylyltransferase GalU [Dehalococcoidia bacterium]|nr:UTP--glucose-1-phosphate uridylyltransferase GalU [Dehalococcoidia bacterium]
MKVRKAVITAAGWGTRFLPITKSQPKEMLPLVNKPLIHYTVDEAINSGIEQIVLVTAISKRAIEDYFDRSFELEHLLEQKKETRLLKEMQELSTLVDVCYVRQKQQLGLGHAVLTARDVVGEEHFAVILPDDIIDSQVPALKQMLAVHEQYGAGVIAVESVATQDLNKYGIIEAKKIGSGTYQVLGLVEKPEPDQAPSNLGIVGRYILSPRIFDVLEKTPRGRGQEIQLTDALQRLLDQQPLYACEFEGKRYDTGTPMGWMKATMTFALKHPEYGPELREYLQQIL